MITQQELDVLVALLNRATLDPAQMYAAQAILRKLQESIQTNQPPLSTSTAPEMDDD